MSTRREGRLERRALVALQRSVPTGCAGATSAGAGALASASTLSPAAPQGSAAPLASGPSASLSAAHAERSSRGGSAAAPRRLGATAVERADTGSSFPSVLVPGLLALLLALAVIALPETRRRLRPNAPQRAAAPGRATDDTLDLMAANIVAQMTRATRARDPRPEAEIHGQNPHVEVEHELLPADAQPQQHPAGPRRQRSAREHATQAALVATAVLGWLARLLRRGRRGRRRRSG